MTVKSKNEGTKIPYEISGTRITFDDDLSLNLILDTGEQYFVKRRNGVLLVYEGESDETADCTLNCTRLQLMGMMMGNQDVFGALKPEGDGTVPVRLVKYMTAYNFGFNIIEP